MKKTFTFNGKKYVIARTAEHLIDALDYEQKVSEIHESVTFDPTDDHFKESDLYAAQKKIQKLLKDFVTPFLNLTDEAYAQSDPVELNQFSLDLYDFLSGGSNQSQVGEQLASAMQSIKSTK